MLVAIAVKLHYNTAFTDPQFYPVSNSASFDSKITSSNSVILTVYGIIL